MQAERPCTKMSNTRSALVWNEDEKWKKTNGVSAWRELTETEDNEQAFGRKILRTKSSSAGKYNFLTAVSFSLVDLHGELSVGYFHHKTSDGS